MVEYDKTTKTKQFGSEIFLVQTLVVLSYVPL